MARINLGSTFVAVRHAAVRHERGVSQDIVQMERAIANARKAGKREWAQNLTVQLETLRARHAQLKDDGFAPKVLRTGGL